MKAILEYLLSKNKKSIEEKPSWDVINELVSKTKDEKTNKIFDFFEEYFPKSFAPYLIDLLIDLHNESFEFNIVGINEKPFIDEKTKIVEINIVDADWDTISLYVTIYNVPKKKAIMIVYDNYFNSINVDVKHYDYIESIIEFCNRGKWINDFDGKLYVKVRNATQNTYDEFENILNEVK